VSPRTILSSPIPSKSRARLNVPDETNGTTVGVGKTVGTARGGVGTAVAVGTGVEVGVGGPDGGVGVGGVGGGVGVGGVGGGVGVEGVGGTGGGVGVEVGVGGTGGGVGVGIGAEVGVAGTGVYRARFSTHPVIANESKPTSTTANLATCTDLRASLLRVLRVTNIIALRVGYREATKG